MSAKQSSALVTLVFVAAAASVWWLVSGGRSASATKMLAVFHGAGVLFALRFVYSGVASMIDPSSEFTRTTSSSRNVRIDGVQRRVSESTGSARVRFSRRGGALMAAIGLALYGVALVLGAFLVP